MASRRPTAVGVYIAAIAGVAAALSLAWPVPLDAAAPIHLTWWILAVGFFLTNAFPVSFRIHGEQHNVCLNEALKVVGLAFASPVALVGGMVVGCTIADWYRARGGSRLKKVFNMALVALEASAAVALYHAVLQGGDPLQPIGWVAAFVGAGLTSIGSAGAIAAAMFLYRGTTWQVSMPRKVWFSTVLSASVSTVIGLLAVITLVIDTRTAVLTAGLFVLAKWGFHSYGDLTEDHEATALLQDLSTRIQHGLGDDDRLVDLVARTRSLLAADGAELRLAAETSAGAGWRTITLPGRQPMDIEPDVLRALQARTAGGGGAIHLRRDDPSASEVFRNITASQIAVAPVVTASGPTGLLIASLDRGVAATFVPDQLRVMQIIAAHAGTALQNAALILALEQRVEEKEHEASHDALTSLANRPSFYGALARATDAAARGETGGVMLIDLDGFKSVNDTAGHHAGDVVLRATARRLARVVRPTDELARIGGDEFAVLVRDIDEIAELLAVADRMHEALTNPVRYEDHQLVVGASIGVALYPRDGTQADELLRHADAAMYVAKRTGSGTHLHRAGSAATP